MWQIKDRPHILVQIAFLELAQLLSGGYGTCRLRFYVFSLPFSVVMFSGE